MKFVSTRNPRDSVDFARALFQGLAPDGGLYRPERMPDLSDIFTGLGDDSSFRDIAAETASGLLSPEISHAAAGDIVSDAFSFEPRLREIREDMMVMELFHGPSCAFKDFGASFLASAMNRLLALSHRRAIIITATSGDTGSAVARAFFGKPRINVVILYPSGRVSPLQEKQLTTLGGNVTALEVRGSFDDCQRMAKAAFTARELKSLPLSSANSINIGRLIPQSFYYIWAWLRMRRRRVRDFAFIVPSGNFGNITAGLYSAAWGLPVQRFIAATNINDVIPEFLRSGTYAPRNSEATVSNAMDVGSPSNFERLSSLYHQDVRSFRNHMEALSVDDETTLRVMADLQENHGYLCCPHTAVGWRVAELYRRRHPDVPVIVLGTAHPGKFLEIVTRACGIVPELPMRLEELLHRPKCSIEMENSDAAFSKWLIDRFGDGS